MKRLFAIVAAILVCGTSTPYPDYGASALQTKVDRSFSAFAINSKFARIRNKLTRADRGCRPLAVCEWRDAEGVRHVFETFENPNPMQMELLVKRIVVSEFGARPIRALGIGAARSKSQVLANIARFDSRIVFDCSPPSLQGNIGDHGCRAETGPGWVEIGFDTNDRLTGVRFEGYFV